MQRRALHQSSLCLQKKGGSSNCHHTRSVPAETKLQSHNPTARSNSSKILHTRQTDQLHFERCGISFPIWIFVSCFVCDV